MKFFMKHQKKLLAALALLLALLMLLPTVSMIFTSADALTQADINKLKNEAAELAQKKKDLNSQLSALKGDLNNAYSRKKLVEQEINVVNDQIANTESLIAQYDQLIAQEEVNLANAQQEEATHFENFCQRVRIMEEQGTVTYWQILFNAADFTDLLDRAMMISETVEYDNAVMASLEQARIDVENTKATLESARTEQVEAKAALDAQKTELDAKEDEIKALLYELESEKSEYESDIHALDRQIEAMDDEIAKKQKELEAQIAASKIQINYGSGYIWPLDGCYVITSLFGPRNHPITGKYSNHGGTDVRAGYGTKIKAARGGVVMTSEYHWSYGNYVVIVHDNGTSTLYAHMSKRAVKAGQTVTQGQVIGYVGSTGSSTGNHLHYELRITQADGSVKRVDALDYYKGMTFYLLDSYGATYPVKPEDL